MLRILKVLLCLAFIFTAACKESVDSITEQILYPFAYADFRNTVPAKPPRGLQQVYLNSVDSNGDSMSIHAWYHHSPSNQNRTLVYFHGNNENLKMLEKRGLYSRFMKMGLNFIVIDYPGLGRSNSFPNEFNMTEAGLAAVQFAMDEFPNSALILWGRSLGAGVASQVAPLVQENLTAFILTSPWSSFPELANTRSELSHSISKQWLKENTYNSMASAKKIRIKSLVQHGKEDSVIPFELGESVFRSFPAGVAEFHAYPKLGHRDIFRTEKVWQAAQSFLRQL